MKTAKTWFEHLLSLSPTELCDWLLNEFYIEQFPDTILTTEDMEKAGELLLRLTNYYSYLHVLLSKAKVLTRVLKRSGDKDAYEDMVDRKEVVQNVTDAIKQQYAAISRAVTIRIENNRELMMASEGRKA